MRLNYRAEIDGLRAIAIVSVILCHAEIIIGGHDRFAGGYIGVDIFFVISGYLISRIVLSELAENGSFSFANFYERRARRILPMLLTVMLVSLPFAWEKLLPMEFVEYSESVLSALFFGSNFYFFFQSIAYEVNNALLLPFLHTWSLGIEEQFYIVFPVLLLLCWRFKKEYILTLGLALLFVSLQFADKMETVDAKANFFLPFSRFWELLAGSLLAYIELKYGRIKNELAGHVFPIIGLFLIGHSIMFFDGDTPHPGFNTLIPVIGVALVIAFCTSQDLVGKVLASKPFVGIGLISYSAYLWHYPIMAFSRIDNMSPPLAEKCGWIAATLVLATISYFLIEKPFRNRARIKRGPFLLCLFVATSLFVGLNGAIIMNDGYKHRVPELALRESYDDKFAHVDLFYKCHRLKGIGRIGYDKFCTLGTHEKNVYLVGDSHMVSIAFKLFERLDKTNMNLVLMTRDGALFGKDEFIDNARRKVLETVKNEIVVLGGYAHFETEEYLDSLLPQYQSLLNILEKNGNKVVLVYPVPETEIQRQNFVQEYEAHRRLLDKISSRQVFDERSKAAYKFYDQFKGDNIYRVYPSDYLCDKVQCYGVKDGVILISDFDHPSKVTAEWMADKILEELKLSPINQ